MQNQAPEASQYMPCWLNFDPSQLPPAHMLRVKQVRAVARRVASYYSARWEEMAITTRVTTRSCRFVFLSSVYGIVVESTHPDGVRYRASCRKFWRKKIEQKANEGRLAHESKYRMVGGAGEGAKLYCSDETLSRAREQKALAEQGLASMMVVNTGTGEAVSLLDVARETEKNRLAGQYANVKSMEEFAAGRGFDWLFVTLTAPSEYHPNPSKGKRKASFDVGVADSHHYIAKQWSRIRSLLSKRGIQAGPDGYFGFRCVEPHKDGCFHWHLLVFLDPGLIEAFSQAIKEKFPGEIASTIVIGDKGKATAATYIYKYLSKNCSTSRQFTDDAGDAEREAKDLASFRNKERVQASLKVSRIRQTAPFGVVRVVSLLALIHKLDLAEVEAKEGSVLQFVRDHIWRNQRALLMVMSNPGIFSRESKVHGVQLIKKEALNSYGELVEQVVGIRIDGREYMNRSRYLIVRR